MATKKEKDQLEKLLSWNRSGLLPEKIELFNRKVSPTSMLREIDEKVWELEAFRIDEDGVRHRIAMIFRHESLINLGLTILDAIGFVDKRG